MTETSTNNSSSAISTYSEEGSGAGIFKNTGSSFGTGLQLGFIFPKAENQHHAGGVSTEDSALSSGMFLNRGFRQSISAFDSNSMFSSSRRVKI